MNKLVLIMVTTTKHLPALYYIHLINQVINIQIVKLEFE